MGGADSHASLIALFKDFLHMASEAKVTINPKKVRIGYCDEQFYGYRINNGKITPADRNLDPVRKMENPKNRSELRSVMGVFNQFSRFIKDYGIEGSPAAIVNELASVKVPYIWTDRHTKALQALPMTLITWGTKKPKTPAAQKQHNLLCMLFTNLTQNWLVQRLADFAP